MSVARPVFKGTTIMLTRRVRGRLFLLKPGKRTNQIVGYVLAVMQKKWNIHIHAVKVLSNHWHVVFTDPDGNAVEFQRDCHNFIARAGSLGTRSTCQTRDVMDPRLVDTDQLEGETFTELDLAAGDLEHKVFTDCIFVDAAWTEAALRRCLFESCEFRGGDFSMLSPYDTSFRGARFDGCKMMGIDWTKAHQLTFDVGFHRCVLSYCTFDAMQLRELCMTDCKAIEAVFTEANLTGANFAGTDLSGATFRDTVLTGADLSLATGYSIDPSNNRLGNTRFSLEGALRTMALLGVLVPSVSPPE